MNMRLMTYTSREMQRRPGRLLLTLIGITLGIASVVATRLTISTVHRAYQDLFEGSTGHASLEVIAPGLHGFELRPVPSLADINGIKTIVPGIQGTVAIVGKTGSVPAVALGIDPGDLANEGLLPQDGTAPGEDECLLEPGLANSLGFERGEVVNLWTPTGQHGLRLTALMPTHTAGGGSAGMLVVPLATAQRLFAMSGRINCIHLNLVENADPHEVQDEVARRLPSELTVQSPGSRGDLSASTLQSVEQALNCLGVVAIVAAAFVILNTFLLNLGERRRHLALLRSLGTTRAQVTIMLLREMVVLGLAGTLAGCLGGAALALLLLRAMERFLGLSLPGVRCSAEPFMLALALGPGLALAAAWLPAWQAGRRPPLGDLLARSNSGVAQVPRWVSFTGLVLLLGGAALALGACSPEIAAPVRRVLLLPSLILVTVGSVLALPIGCTPLLRLSAAVLRPVLGLEVTLGCQQLRRYPIRTWLTAGVLYLALAVVIGFGHLLLGMLQDLQHWYRQTIVSEYLVRAAMPDTAFLLTTAMPEDLGDEIGAIDDVAVVDRIAFVPGRANDRPILVLARTFAADRPLPLSLQEGEAEVVRRQLMRGDAVLGSGLARQLGLHGGDRITLQTPHGPRELRIAGTVTEFAVGGQALYLEWSAAGQLLDLEGAHVFLVSAKPGATARLAAPLREFCDRHHLLLQSNAQMHEVIDRLLQRVTALLWTLMVLTFAVASVGIVNTLSMNVREQTRQFGLLRALGLKRGQVRRVVLSQALLLGIMSLIPGIVGGELLAMVIQRGDSFRMADAAFRLDGVLVAGASMLALAVTLLAALLPARRAVRLPIMRALQE
jgi:putative ABC transport system permease protein